MQKTTVHTDVISGVPVTIPNRTDDVETGSPHWYISYNNYDRATYGSDTTALVLGQMEYFLILNGDHRQGLKNAIENPDIRLCRSRLGRCLAYVRDHRDKLNKMSDPLV